MRLRVQLGPTTTWSGLSNSQNQWYRSAPPRFPELVLISTSTGVTSGGMEPPSIAAATRVSGPFRRHTCEFLTRDHENENRERKNSKPSSYVQAPHITRFDSVRSQWPTLSVNGTSLVASHGRINLRRAGVETGTGGGWLARRSAEIEETFGTPRCFGTTARYMLLKRK